MGPDKRKFHLMRSFYDRHCLLLLIGGVLIWLLFFNVNSSFAQTPEPFGFGGGDQWIRSDRNLTKSPTSNKVKIWNRYGPAGGNCTMGTPDSASLQLGSMNYNPSVHINDPGYIEVPEDFTASGEFFLVFKTTESASSTSLWYRKPGLVTAYNGNNSYGVVMDGGSIIYGIRANSGARDSVIATGTYNDGKPHILHVEKQKSNTAANKYCRIWIDGVLVGTAATNNNDNLDAASKIMFGHMQDSTSATRMDMDMAEFIIYNGLQNDLGAGRVTTYLGIKYGITLGQNYYWDDAGPYVELYNIATHGNEIVGIGYEDNNARSDFMQRQSVPADDPNGMRIYYGSGFSGTYPVENDSNTNDIPTINTFVITGHDNAAVTFTSDIGIGLTNNRMDRTFKVQEYGNVGTVTLVFGTSYGLIAGSNYYLVQSSDMIFNGNDNFIAMTDVGGGVFEVPVNFTANDTSYYTISTTNSFAGPYPGGVGSNLQLWLKADQGFTNPNWADQAGGNFNMVHSGPSITLNSSSLVWRNYLSTTTLDRQFRSNYVLKGQTIFAVGKASGGSQWDGYMGFDPDYGMRSVSVGVNAVNQGTNADDWTENGTLRQDGLNLANNANASLNNWTLIGGYSNVAWLGEFFLGGYFDNGRTFSSYDFAEILVYDASVAASYNSIETYLAVRYGLTLQHDYILSDGTTNIFNRTTAAPYVNDIAAIVRDDNGALNQKKSMSSNLDAVVSVGIGAFSLNDAQHNDSHSGSFSIDKRYFAWGNNNGNANWSNEELVIATDPNLYVRINREWRYFDNTPGTITIRLNPDNPNFDIGSLDYGATAYYIFLDDDGDFSNGGTTSAIMSQNGAYWEVTLPSFNYATKSYFTFGMKVDAISWDEPSYCPNTTAYMYGSSIARTGGRCAQIRLVCPVDSVILDHPQRVSGNQKYTILDNILSPDDLWDSISFVVPNVPALIGLPLKVKVMRDADGCAAANYTYDGMVFQDSITIDTPSYANIAIQGMDSAYFCLGGTNDTLKQLTPDPGFYYLQNSSLSNLNQLLDPGTFEIILTSSNIGTHEIRFVTSAGCNAEDTVWISIDSMKTSTVSYPYTSICQDSTIISPTVFPSLGPDSWFESFPPTLSINSLTGDVNASASDSGSYVIIYHPASDSCYNTSMFTLHIDGRDTATFSYDAARYCKYYDNEYPINVIIPQGIAGTYTSTSGNFVVNPTNGELDLTNSIAGIDTIRFNMIGACGNYDSYAVIRIDSVPKPSFTIPNDTLCINAGTVPITNIFPTGFGINSIFSNWTGDLSLSGSNIIAGSSNIGGPFPLTLTTSQTFSFFPFHACTDSTTQNVWILGVDSVSVAYPMLSYCKNDSNPIPVIFAGLAGGTFSASGGLVFVDPLTGEVDLNATPAGTYSITYTPADTLCASSNVVASNFTVYAIPDASFTMDSTTICQNSGNMVMNVTGASDSVKVYLGPSYQPGLNSGTTIFINLMGAGNSYIIRNYDGNGSCVDSQSVVITILPADNPGFAYPGDTICDNQDDPIPLMLGTTGGYFYSPNGAVVDSTMGLLDLDSTGQGTYTVFYQTIGTCPAIDSATITIQQGENASFTYPSTEYCSTDGIISVTAASPGGLYTISPASTAINSTTGDLNLGQVTFAPGAWEQNFTITHTVGLGLDSACVAKKDFSITVYRVDDSLDLDYANYQYCPNVDSIVPFFYVSNHGRPGQFTASAGVYFLDASRGVINPSGTITQQDLIVSFTLDGPCGETVSDTIQIYAKEFADFEYPQSEYCGGVDSIIPSLLLDSTGIFTYVSSGGGNFDLFWFDQQLGIINGDSTSFGDFEIFHTTGGNCPDVDSFNITIQPAPIVTIDSLEIYPNSPYVACKGSSISIDPNISSGTLEYILNGIPYAIKNYFSMTLDSDSVVVEVVLNKGACYDTLAFPIIFYGSDIPGIQFLNPDTLILNGEDMSITVQPVSNNTQYFWRVAEYPEGVLSLDQTSGTTGFLNVTDSLTIPMGYTFIENFTPVKLVYTFTPLTDGCAGAVDSLVIWVYPDICGVPVLVPGVMTPNYDGINDNWEIRWTGDNSIADQYSITLYNRSGGRVDYMYPLVNNWNNPTLPDGVYWWVLTDELTKEVVCSGGLTIRRK